MVGPLRKWRRHRAAKRPWISAWDPVVHSALPYYRVLDESERSRLQTLIQIFVAEKNFIGVGVTVTEEHRVAIATCACLLILNRDRGCYDRLDDIVIYPSEYRVREQVTDAIGVVTDVDDSRLGESWNAGVVVLSLTDVEEAISSDGQRGNVIFHEFAHQLDAEDGVTDGAPALGSAEARAAWARTFRFEYRRLRRAVQTGRRTLIDPYGATDPAEFFAVVTEEFFLEPQLFRERHGELYAQLKSCYGLDPAVLAARLSEDPEFSGK